jgi:hypothetical protein
MLDCLDRTMREHRALFETQTELLRTQVELLRERWEAMQNEGH